MGRKIKIGLDYFPMDVNFFDDIKVRKLIKHKGSVSILVYSYLLSLIYKDGYFLKWDEDLPFIIYEKIGQDESYIKDVINYLIDIEMFSKYMFEKENILTSKGIQKRYKKICDTLKRSNSIDIYNLINTEEIQINTEETAIDTEETNENDIETDINSGESATKEGKGKEGNGIEENKNKEEEIIKPKKQKKSEYDLSFIDTKFLNITKEWLEYKTDRKESYKSKKSINTFYKLLLKYSNNNPTIAEKIIERSMANNWAGIFELKTNTDKQTPQSPTPLILDTADIDKARRLEQEYLESLKKHKSVI